MAELPEIENNPNRGRIGKFNVDCKALCYSNWPKILAAMEFVPLRVECMYYSQYEYIGFSPIFRELEQSETRAIFYDLKITESENGEFTVEAIEDCSPI